MDSDARAAAIAAMLKANDIAFQFKGSGAELSQRGRLVWETVTVWAIHPDTGERTALTSFLQASEYLLRLLKKAK